MTTRCIILIALICLGVSPVGAQTNCDSETTDPCGVDDNSTETPTFTPMPSPTPTQSPLAQHDWRSPGYPAVVGGVLYDPLCVPLESVGSNVLNLPFRAEQAEELEWMRSHNIRWMRVLATGHGLAVDRAPRDSASAAAALQSLLAWVDEFNSVHAPSESIYVLVGLTDYYPPGVPGDGHAYDHPIFKDVPVLAAPWYRAGVPLFDFDQEHGYGRLTGLPNYEQFYKPWVQTIVSALANSRSLLGWQVGNELKARGDEDGERGVTDAPDAAAMWEAWSSTGARLEAANRAAGPSSTCLAASST